MPTTTFYPNSRKVALAANAVTIVPGSERALQLQIPAGSTVTVATTIASGDDISAGTADWFTWADGAKLGPYIKEIPPCTAIRLTNGAAAGYVNLMQA